jgi:hypothetical protein
MEFNLQIALNFRVEQQEVPEHKLVLVRAILVVLVLVLDKEEPQFKTLPVVVAVVGMVAARVKTALAVAVVQVTLVV